MDRIILPDDVVEKGGFNISVSFPSEENRPPVVVRFVRRNWAVVTFADRLSRACHADEEDEDEIESSGTQGGPYLLLTESAGMVIAMVDPYRNRISQDLSTLGSYGIDESTKNLKLVVPNADLVEIINLLFCMLFSCLSISFLCCCCSV